jgi:DNA-binding MarR family transcriptional regulator
MEITSGQICEDLVALMGHAKSNMIALAEEVNMTPIQVFALYAVLKGEATMGSVASALHCDASNVTGIVDRLVSQGLVVRQESEHDRRTKTLQLTTKGKETIATVMSKLPKSLGCDKLTATECATLHTAISKLTSA